MPGIMAGHAYNLSGTQNRTRLSIWGVLLTHVTAICAQLSRQVGLKIRPDAFAEDPDRLAPGALEASESATKTPSNTASMLASQCGK